MALGSSFDCIGPIGRSVRDVETIFTTIVGKDPLDSTSRDTLKNPPKKKETITIGVLTDALSAKGLDEDVRINFEHAIQTCKGAGFKITEVSIPLFTYSLAAYYIIMPAEASANLARFDGVKYGLFKGGETLLDDYLRTRGEGFGHEVRRRIMLGTYVLSAGYYDAYYGKANQVRAQITRGFQEAFSDVDAIIMPTTPTPAFSIGEKSDPLTMYLSDIFTVPINVTGLPALSIPSGVVVRNGKHLPLGLQIVAPHFREDILFEVGAACATLL